MGEWDDLRWFIVLNGIADAWLWDFDADGWRLRHGNPACGMLGVLPGENGARPITLDQSMWFADVLAFDHDAPVGVKPALKGKWPHVAPKDTAAQPPFQPIGPIGSSFERDYWDTLAEAHGAAASLRFGDSYVLRYADDDSNPGTNFRDRFSGREGLLALYAMAARQADVLAEYLCLYRVLEAVDQGNGKRFVSAEISDLVSRRFGNLYVVSQWRSAAPEYINAFDEYRARASAEIDRVRAQGVDDISDYLYRIRNQVAHGKTNVLTHDHGSGFQAAARAIPILKLLARRAVEPT